MSEEQNTNSTEVNNTPIANENSNPTPNDILMDNNQPDTQSLAEEPKNKSVKLWGILLFVVIIASVGGIAYYIMLGLNSKALTMNGINKMLNEYKTITNPLNIKHNFSMDKIQIDNKYTFEVNDKIGELKDIINSTDINTKMSYDKNNKKILTNVDLKIAEVNQQLDAYLNNKEGYVLIKDIYDKYLKLDELDYDIFEMMITEEDINHIIKITKDSIYKNLDESLFTKKINFPNAESELYITRQQMVIIINNIKNDILNDAKVKKLLEVYNAPTEEVNKQITESDIDFDNITIKVNQSILTPQINSIEYIVKSEENTSKMTFIKDNNTSKMVFYDNEKEEANINLTTINKNFTLEYNNKNYSSSDFTLTGTDENGYYTYKLNSKESKIEIINKIKITSGSNIIYEGNVELKYQDYDIKVNYNGSISPLTTDINVDTSNAVKAEEITDEEIEQIETKLYQKFSPIINKFNNSLGTDYDM